ncbi:family 20 glycosylhydrolase [Thalassotalea litorea]|nr:family 20 glycosylhydrolase [Thalassotalea litorea]
MSQHGIFVFVIILALSGCSPNDTSEKPRNELPASPAKLTQSTLNRFASELDVKMSILANKSNDCQVVNVKPSGEGGCYEVRVELVSPIDIESDNWQLYFSQVDPLKYPIDGEFIVEHVNGDLHRILPGKDYKGLSADTKYSIEFISRNFHITEAEYMPNMYLAADNLQARVIASTKTTTDPETGLETRPFTGELTDYSATFGRGSEDETVLATSSHLYVKYQSSALDSTPVATGIIPNPLHVSRNSEDTLDLVSGINISLENIEKTHISAALERLASFGITETTQGVPVTIFKKQPRENKPAGTYQLNIKNNGIEIFSYDAAGAAYALYSISALLQLGDTHIPVLSIKDEPRYEFRGMHVDVARNFHSKDFILDLLDQMAAYKLNKLHLHLGDDEGWRLEIKDLPELTDIGSKRCHDLTEQTCLIPQLGSGPSGNTDLDGYYTIDDYIEILKAASARHIEVIPSFDMPGHSRAVIKSMEARYHNYMKKGNKEEAERYRLIDPNDDTVYESIQFYNDNTINACIESSYAFFEKVIDEVQSLHQQADHPLEIYHIGADETAGAWKDSPACLSFVDDNPYGVTSIDQLGAYFIERVSHYLADKGIKPAGWSDGMGHTHADKMPENVQSNSWGVLSWGELPETIKQVNQGWDVVLSTPDALYFDFPHEADPKEAGYSWASRHISTKKLFQFMPDNLPVLAELWVGPDGKRFAIDDRLQKDEDGKVIHKPLAKGKGFVGIQGQIWSETIRSDDQAEYQVFPRLLALAERAWHKPDWEIPYNHEGALYDENSGVFTPDLQKQQEQDWNRFANIVGQKELKKLEHANIAYRLPTPGAVIENGMLKTNVIFPGLIIEYKVNQGSWQEYTDAIKVLDNAEIAVRTRAPIGKRKGRTINAN